MEKIPAFPGWQKIKNFASVFVLVFFLANIDLYREVP